MNIIRNSTAATVALVLSLGLAFPAAAQGIYGTVDSTTQGTVNVGTTGNTKTDVGVDVQVGVDGSASASGSGTSGSGATQGSADTDTDVSVQAGGGADVDVATLLITRVDVDTNAVEAKTIAASDVKTSADLSGYVAAQMKSDNNISAVESASDSVSVTYKQKAKLFGFIPVTLNARAVVDAQGNVTISYPWYAFLAVTNKADLQAKVQGRVNTDVNLGGGADANASTAAAARLTADTQAKVVAAVKAAMQAQFDVDADAGADARVNKIDGMTVKQ